MSVCSQTARERTAPLSLLQPALREPNRTQGPYDLRNMERALAGTGRKPLLHSNFQQSYRRTPPLRIFVRTPVPITDVEEQKAKNRLKLYLTFLLPTDTAIVSDTPPQILV